MKQMMTLLRREYWESRGGFVTTPIVVGSIVIGLTLITIATAAILVTKVNGEEFVLSKFGEMLTRVSPGDLEIGLDLNILGLATLFNMVLFVVVFFYLLGGLYDDRKDRSILFWRSMPVSDLSTVLSKLISAVLIAPLISVAIFLVTQIILMIIGSLLLLTSGVSPMEYLWGPADPLMVVGLLLVGYAVQALWMLPVWGWLLLCSAFSRNRPFLWAFFVPILAIMADSWLSIVQTFTFTTHDLGRIVAERFIGGAIPLALTVDDNFQIGGWVDLGGASEHTFPLSISAMLTKLGSSSMWWGVLIGILLIAAAVYIRRYRDDY